MDSGEDYDPFDEYDTDDYDTYYDGDENAEAEETLPRLRGDYMEAFSAYTKATKGLSPIDEVILVERPGWDIGNTVTLKIGDWEKEIELNQYPKSFLHEVYYDVMEERGEKVLELSEASMGLLPRQWDAYHILLKWIDRGEYIFYMGPNDKDAQKMRDENTLPIIHYADVAFAIGTLGMKNDRWMLYVVLDERTPASERYHIDLARGRMITETVGKNMVDRYRGWPRKMGLAMSTIKEEAKMIYSGETKENVLSIIDNVLIGMSQNAYLSMIGDGSSYVVEHQGRVDVKKDNKIIGTGLEVRSLLQGLNWAYLTPSDILVLCDQIGIELNEVVLDFVRLPGDYNVKSDGMSALDVTGFAIPLAYWLEMEAMSDDSSPLSLGLQELTTNGKYDDLLRNFALINRRVIVAPSEVTSGRRVSTIHNLYMSPTVKYMRQYLGLLALRKIYKVMKSHYDRTGDSKTELFLETTLPIVSPILNKKYTKEEIWRIAKNDKNGLLLTRVPTRGDNGAYEIMHPLKKR